MAAARVPIRDSEADTLSQELEEERQKLATAKQQAEVALAAADGALRGGGLVVTESPRARSRVGAQGSAGTEKQF